VALSEGERAQLERLVRAHLTGQQQQGRTLEPDDVGSRIVEVVASADRAAGAYLLTAEGLKPLQ
jgi:hypothetical protein